MRLPTSYGSVYKLSGKRRRPWCVRVTTGWSDEGKQERSILGYYVTKTEALQALADYNANPYTPGGDCVSFATCYDRWSAEHYVNCSESNAKCFRAAYKIVNFADKPIKEIRLFDLENAARASGKNYPTLKNYKSLVRMVFDWAFVHDLLPLERRDIPSYLDLSVYSSAPKAERVPFTKSEINKLWDHVNSYPYLSVVLMLIYSGLRISELLELRRENVHLDDKCFYIASSKTQAGVRWVPIADKVFAFWQFWYDKNTEFILSLPNGSPVEYTNFRKTYWFAMMEGLGLSHDIHETRHTFISLMTEAGVDPRVLKQIVGHAGQNVTEAVYTHLDMQTKLDAVNKI